MTMQAGGVRLSLEVDDRDVVPYFLWDEPMSVAELRSRLAGADPP